MHPARIAAFVFLTASAIAQGVADPETTTAGRTHFLGREIAQTMHWRGATWLMRATREDEENGALLHRWLAVKPGQVVCDLGCGNGYHTLPLADAVGETGRVLAVDLQPEMLRLLAARLAERGLTNVERIEATVDDPKLPVASCDLVLLVDVYHELSHPVRVMQHVARALKPGGRVVLVEFRAEDPAVPIKPEHTMSKAQVVRELAEHGFRLTDACDDLPWQHAMAFAPAPDPSPRQQAAELVRGALAAAARGDARELAPYASGSVAPGDLEPFAGRRLELAAGPEGTLLAAADADTAARDAIALRRDEAGRWFVAAVGPRRPWTHPHGAARAFVAMQTSTRGGTTAERVARALDRGYDGVAWDLTALAEVRRACEARGGDLVSAYGVLDVEAGDAALAPFRAAMAALTGGPGMLWLGVRQKGIAPRDPAGDDAAGRALTDLLATAEATGVEIALYPHHGFWLETAADALRLCARVDHERLGLVFNLCHFLRTGDDADPAPLLTRCAARLFAVTVNGADRAGDDWRTLIRPLDEGDYEVRGLLDTLDALGFHGPIGLQGYGIELPADELLQRSMAAWRALHGR